MAIFFFMLFTLKQEFQLIKHYYKLRTNNKTYVLLVKLKYTYKAKEKTPVFLYLCLIENSFNEST